MKKLILFCAIISSFGFFSCSNTEKKVEITKEVTTAKGTYVCPMHPEITSDKPGTCSECGMDLEKAETTETTTDTTTK